MHKVYDIPLSVERKIRDAIIATGIQSVRVVTDYNELKDKLSLVCELKHGQHEAHIKVPLDDLMVKQLLSESVQDLVVSAIAGLVVDEWHLTRASSGTRS